MSDPLTRAVNATFWPWLSGEGFSGVTARMFTCEKRDVSQQFGVGAHSVAGRRNTRIVLCANHR